MTCPDATTGSVTDQTGTVNGSTPSFSDGYWDRQGWENSPPANSQWQGFAVLSDKPSACSHYRANQEVKGELSLVLGLAAGRLDSGALPFPAPGSHGVASVWSDGAGNSYQWNVTFVQKSANNCHHTERVATSGTVTLTAMDDLTCEGSYDLTFGSSGSLAGTFVAPRCGVSTSLGVSGCPARAAQQTCVS